MWQEITIYIVFWSLLGLSISCLFGVENCRLEDPACATAIALHNPLYLVHIKDVFRLAGASIIITSPIYNALYMISEVLQSHGIRSDGFLSYTKPRISFMINYMRFVSGLGAAILIAIQGNSLIRVTRDEILGTPEVVLWTSLIYSGSKEPKVDSDIAGPGVRFSTDILLGSTAVSLAIGSFHSAPTGTKELGICTLLSKYPGKTLNISVADIRT